MPWLVKNAFARSQNPAAVSFFSFSRISEYANREWSSIAECK